MNSYLPWIAFGFNFLGVTVSFAYYVGKINSTVAMKEELIKLEGKMKESNELLRLEMVRSYVTKENLELKFEIMNNKQDTMRERQEEFGKALNQALSTIQEIDKKVSV